MAALTFKWLAAVAWAAAVLVAIDAFLPLGRDETVWRRLAPSSPRDVGEMAARALGWWGNRLARHVPGPVREWVRGTSGRLPGRLTAEGWLALGLGGGLGGVLWLLPVGRPLAPGFSWIPQVGGRLALGFALGSSGVFAWLHVRASERNARVARDLPGFVDLLLLGLEGGLGLDGALGEAARRLEGPLHEELTGVERQVALGLPRAEALRAMSDRLGLRELTTLVSLLTQAERLGNGVTKAVSAIARRLRTSRVMAAERRAGEAPVKMIFPLVFCLFPSVLVFLIGPVLLGKGTLFG